MRVVRSQGEDCIGMGGDRERQVGGGGRVAFEQQVCTAVQPSGGIIGTADTSQLVLALLHWKKCS